MKFLKDRKGQGAFEYILLLAGVLLIVVLAIIILRGSVLSQANTSLVAGSHAIQEQTDLNLAMCGGYNNPSVAYYSNLTQDKGCMNQSSGIGYPLNRNE